MTRAKSLPEKLAILVLAWGLSVLSATVVGIAAGAAWRGFKWGAGW